MWFLVVEVVSAYVFMMILMVWTPGFMIVIESIFRLRDEQQTSVVQGWALLAVIVLALRLALVLAVLC